jgi:hypothetical protein
MKLVRPLNVSWRLAALALVTAACSGSGSGVTPPPADTGADLGTDLGPKDAGAEVSAPPDVPVMDVVATDATTSDVADATDVSARCGRDEDCASSSVGSVCDVSTGRCVQCLAARDTCPAAQRCDETANTCVAGCRNDEGCAGDGGAGARCNTTTHACVECVTNDHCGPGRLCVGSTCVTGCDPSHGCPSGQSCCGGACVETASNTAHCGRCDNLCAAANATAACTNGTCGVGTCNAPFADCNAMAADGCEVDTSSAVAHCGACGVVCATPNGTPACVMGVCGSGPCSAGYGNCDGMAPNGCETDTRTNTAHCGTCGNACATGQMCIASVCVTPNPTPALTMLTPPEVIRGTGATTLRITGTGFATGATVNFGATALTPTSVTATEVTVTLPVGELATPREVEVTVTNPAPGGGQSNALRFRVTHPPVAVAWSPGVSVVHVYSAVPNTVEVATLNASGAYVARPALVLGTDGVGSVRDVPQGAVRITGTAPFLAWIHDELSGDKISAGSTITGEGRGSTVLTWGGSSVTVFSHDAAPGLVRLQRFDGSAFTDIGMWTPAGRDEFRVFATGASSVYRVIARDSAVTAVGQVLTETYNHFGYLASASGSPRGTDFAYAEPPGAPGVRRMVVQSLSAATTVTFAGATPTGPITLAEAGDLTSATFGTNVLARATTSAPSIAWIEADPGNGRCDGTLLDADLVPSTRGATVDTEFLFRTTTQPVECYVERRPDLDVLGYSDGTMVSVYTGTSTTPVMTAPLNRGGRVRIGANLGPSLLYRVTATRPVAVEMSHEAGQFAIRLRSIANTE